MSTFKKTLQMLITTTRRSFLNVLRSFPKGKNNLLQRRVDIFKNLMFVQSWALSKGSIQKAGVFYIKIFACNFRLHSKVCIFIEFLPLLPRNVTKSHQHTREICRGLFNIWHNVPPWCSLASAAYSLVAFLFSRGLPPKPSGVFAYGEVLGRVCS